METVGGGARQTIAAGFTAPGWLVKLFPAIAQGQYFTIFKEFIE